MHRWVHLTEQEAKKMVEDGKIGAKQGYHFEITGKKIVEYHVDDHPEFQERGAKLHRFGGLLSVWMPEGVLPIMVIGKDEAIFW